MGLIEEIVLFDPQTKKDNLSPGEGLYSRILVPKKLKSSQILSIDAAKLATKDTTNPNFQHWWRKS